MQLLLVCSFSKKLVPLLRRPAEAPEAYRQEEDVPEEARAVQFSDAVRTEVQLRGNWSCPLCHLNHAVPGMNREYFLSSVLGCATVVDVSVGRREVGCSEVAFAAPFGVVRGQRR